MTEGISFIIAALIRDSARFSNLAPVWNTVAINQANKATRLDSTSHCKLNMRHLFNMGHFIAMPYNQKDVDSTRIDGCLARHRDIKFLQQHITPSENKTDMRQAISGQPNLELQYDNLCQGHSRRFNDTGLHGPDTGRLTVSHHLNRVTHHS